MKKRGTRTQTKKKKNKKKKVTAKKLRKPQPNRISSGIKGFDRLIEGGLLPKSVNLVVGGSGSGKTIFALQFLVDGALKGEGGIYVTFEEKRERMYEDMARFGWDLAALEKKRKLVIIEYTPEQVKKMLEEGGGEIERIIEETKAKRMVIDSITSFALLFESELEKREASLALFELLRKWDCTSILTLQQEENRRDKIVEHVSTALEFEADSIILLYFPRPDGTRIRELEVLKMRGTAHSKKMYRFHIANKGVVIGG